MSPHLTLAVAVLAAVGASFAVTSLRNPPPASTPVDLTSIQNELQSLRSALDNLRTAPAAAAPSASDRVALSADLDSQIAAAVERHLAARKGTATEAALSDKPAFDVAATAQSLRSHSSYWSDPDKYKRAFAAGKMQDLIDAMKQHAQANPNDAQAQTDLGNAYLAWLQMDNTRYDLSEDADKAYDAALAVDPSHWEARFTKAVSYTFWPEFMGKKNEAIQHFERLVEQQDRMPVQDHEAQTYLFLGNLIEAKEPARAREMWQRGLTRHPTSKELQQRLQQR